MARTALILLLGTPFLLAAQPVGSWLLLEFGDLPFALLVAAGVTVVAACIGGILLGRKAARGAFAVSSESQDPEKQKQDLLAPGADAESDSEQRRGSWDFLSHPKVASNYDRWNQLMEQRTREARAQRANVGVH